MGLLQKIHRTALIIIVGGYAAVSFAGLVGFLAARSTSVTSPIGKAPEVNPEKDVNLAHFKHGSWIEASSYAWLYIHHPLFAVDGLRNPPSKKEEWVPDRRTDKSPFLTVHLGRKADVSEIIVIHEHRYSERYYNVSCLSDGKVLDLMQAKNTKEVRVSYPLTCKKADAVKLDFTWDPYDPEGHIRIYEIEVWGR